MSRYRTTIREALEEIYVNEAQSHTVRYTDPLNKKRFAVPFKTHDAAEKKMAQLKKDGVKDIKITKDTLKPGIKFKEGVIPNTQSAKNKLYKDYIKQGLHPDAAAELVGNAVAEQDDKDHEISMARGELEAIADKATQLASMLQGKSDEGNPLEAWVQSKITKAKDYINSVSDYLTYNPDMNEQSKTDMERVADLRTRQMILQTKLKDLDPADPKNKTPIAITKNDIENIQMKMDQIRKDTKEEVDGQRPGPTNPNPNSINEKIEGIENKSEKSGIPYGILKQVYDRGMAAWKGGHRPGTTPQQWAFARINSFITKGKTYYTADADLAKKARKSKKK